MATVHVAVAVIAQDQQVLISLRKPEQHQGNLWEFPGGKVEADEIVFDALVRETREELNIEVIEAKPLIKLAHDYGDKSVLLDAWSVEKFDGIPHGREGQRVKWCEIAQLDLAQFPAANGPIISAVKKLNK